MRLKTGLMLTEFGVASADPASHQTDFPLYYEVTQLAEQHFVSYTV